VGGNQRKSETGKKTDNAVHEDGCTIGYRLKSLCWGGNGCDQFSSIRIRVCCLNDGLGGRDLN
jgi:hypothetical protein